MKVLSDNERARTADMPGTPECGDHTVALGGLMALIGGAQRTPFSQVGAPVFSACERLGFGMAAGRSTGCRDTPFNICMESTTLHAYIEVRVHSLCR